MSADKETPTDPKLVWNRKDEASRQRAKQAELKKNLGIHAKSSIPPAPFIDDKDEFVFPNLIEPDQERRRRFLARAVQNPLVPLGMALTTGALLYGIRCMVKRDRRGSQMAMRYRVGFQMATIAVLFGGIVFSSSHEQSPQGE